MRYASMRPGRNAPDNTGIIGEAPMKGLASMRPGRNAPDNAANPPVPRRGIARASMRPGRNAPDNLVHNCMGVLLMAEASMRPGRNAPDNHWPFGKQGTPGYGFNEAGAKCPG